MVSQASLSIRLAKPLLVFVRAHCWLGFGDPWRRTFRCRFLRGLGGFEKNGPNGPGHQSRPPNTANSAFLTFKIAPIATAYGRTTAHLPTLRGAKLPHRDGCAPPPVRIGNACPRVISFDLAQYQGLRLHGSVLPLPLAGAGRRGSTPARRAWCRNSHRCTT